MQYGYNHKCNISNTVMILRRYYKEIWTHTWSKRTPVRYYIFGIFLTNADLPGDPQGPGFLSDPKLLGRPETQTSGPIRRIFTPFDAYRGIWLSIWIKTQTIVIQVYFLHLVHCAQCYHFIFRQVRRDMIYIAMCRLLHCVWLVQVLLCFNSLYY